jgi:hypothetical protein
MKGQIARNTFYVCKKVPYELNAINNPTGCYAVLLNWFRKQARIFQWKTVHIKFYRFSHRRSTAIVNPKVKATGSHVLFASGKTDSRLYTKRHAIIPSRTPAFKSSCYHSVKNFCLQTPNDSKAQQQRWLSVHFSAWVKVGLWSNHGSGG